MSGYSYSMPADVYAVGAETYTTHDIAGILKASAGNIISRLLEIEHMPPGAHSLMQIELIHDFAKATFREVVVDCLAAYFYELEQRREEVLEAIICGTRSKYGMRMRLVESAIRRANGNQRYDLVLDMKRRITPKLYGDCVKVVYRTVFDSAI